MSIVLCSLILLSNAARADGEMGTSIPAVSAPAESPAEGVLRVTLKPEAPVRGTWITLGDVAELSGPDADRLDELKAVQLAHVPLAGAQRLMTRDQVLKRLRAMAVTERVEFEGGADASRITAVVKPLAGDALVRFGHDYLAARAARPGGTVTIEDPETPRAVAIPDVAVTYRAEASGRRMTGLVPVAVEAWSGDRRLARVLLSYRVRTVAMVARLAKALEPGAVIGESDVETVERDLTGVPDDALTSRDALIGLRVVRPLTAGAFVRREAVAQALQVKRGSQVTLIARVGSVTAKAMAQSKDDGANGDVITVVNLDSKRLLKARVVDPGTVEAVMP